MGRAKQMLEEGMNFESYLEEILGNIDDIKVQGIAKLAISKGIKMLSSKQQFILKEGLSAYILEKCPNCGLHIDYEDMYEAVINGMCYDCRSHWEKMQAE